MKVYVNIIFSGAVFFFFFLIINIVKLCYGAQLSYLEIVLSSLGLAVKIRKAGPEQQVI